MSPNASAFPRSATLAAACFTVAGLASRADADVKFTVSAAAPTHAISPYIYGTNDFALQGNTVSPYLRYGGNRWTACNWENNASNAGSDYLYQSDGYLSSSSNVPGAALAGPIASTTSRNQALMLTIPTAGYVAADKSGPVPYAQWAPANGTATNPAYTPNRFNLSLPSSPNSPALSPNLSDGRVYANEYVNFVQQTAGASRSQPIFYSLDNEPDLWSSTHAELRVNNATSTGY